MKSLDLSVLPEAAQQEVYDFFLFIKQRVSGPVETRSRAGDCAHLSEPSLAQDWNTPEEEQAWRSFSVGDIVLVRFPFSDLSQQKLRPALILADVRTGRLHLMPDHEPAVF